MNGQVVSGLIVVSVGETALPVAVISEPIEYAMPEQVTWVTFVEYIVSRIPRHLLI